MYYVQYLPHITEVCHRLHQFAYGGHVSAMPSGGGGMSSGGGGGGGGY